MDEYERRAHAGVLTQCDRVELLDGEIVEMPLAFPDLALTVDELLG